MEPKGYSSDLKLILGIGSFLFFLLGFSSIEFWFFYFFGSLEEVQYTFIDVFQIGSIVVSIVLLWYFFKEEGLYIKDNEIYRSDFFFGKPIRLIKMNIKGVTDIAVVEYKNKHPRYNEYIGRLDDFGICIVYKVFLLNEYHTKRKLVYETNDQFMAEDIATFIENNLKLTRGVFNPPKYSRRR